MVPDPRGLSQGCHRVSLPVPTLPLSWKLSVGEGRAWSSQKGHWGEERREQGLRPLTPWPCSSGQPPYPTLRAPKGPQAVRSKLFIDLWGN